MATVVETPVSTQLSLAGRVRPGDRLLCDGRVVEIARVKRAQGRKPKTGENLHLVADGEVVKVNSLAPVRIEARRP